MLCVFYFVCKVQSTCYALFTYNVYCTCCIQYMLYTFIILLHIMLCIICIILITLIAYMSLYLIVNATSYGCFLKWWYPTTIGFPTKNDHFGVFWGYHHLRRHSYTSRAARGGGGSFKNRKRIGEIGCCESRMTKRKH